MKKALYILAVSISFSINIYAQTDAKKDLEAINKKYAIANTFKASITYSLFIDGTLESEEKATVKRKDSLFHYALKDLEILNSTKYKLFINHISKEISVMPTEKLNANSVFKIPLDTAITQASKVSKETIVSGQQKITLLYENSLYEKIEILYFQNSYKVNAIKVYFSSEQGAANQIGIDDQYANSKLRFEIALHSFVVNPAIESTAFAVSKYITENKSRISLTNGFKGYELYNFLY